LVGCKARAIPVDKLLDVGPRNLELLFSHRSSPSAVTILFDRINGIYRIHIIGNSIMMSILSN
jgi:hypothetical protein